MRKLGADMDYYGGFGLMGDRGREMLGAAKLAKGWTSHIAKMAETIDGKANPADKTKCKTIPCLNCQRVAVMSKSGKNYVCQTCGKREAA
jgi:precorrin-6B methylase 1